MMAATAHRCVLKTAHMGQCLYVGTAPLPWWYCGKAGELEGFEDIAKVQTVVPCPEFHDCPTCNPPSTQKPVPIAAVPTVKRVKRNARTR